MRLRAAETPNAAAYVRAVLAQQQRDGAAADAAVPLEPDPQRPPRTGLRFYRAEPVPPHWGRGGWSRREDTPPGRS